MDRRVVGLVALFLFGAGRAGAAMQGFADPGAQGPVGITPLRSLDQLNGNPSMAGTAPRSAAPPAIGTADPTASGPSNTVPSAPVGQEPVGLTPMRPIGESIERGHRFGRLSDLFRKDRTAAAGATSSARSGPARATSAPPPEAWSPAQDVRRSVHPDAVQASSLAAPGPRPAPYANRPAPGPRRQLDPAAIRTASADPDPAGLPPDGRPNLVPAQRARTRSRPGGDAGGSSPRAAMPSTAEYQPAQGERPRVGMSVAEASASGLLGPTSGLPAPTNLVPPPPPALEPEPVVRAAAPLEPDPVPPTVAPLAMPEPAPASTAGPIPVALPPFVPEQPPPSAPSPAKEPEPGPAVNLDPLPSLESRPSPTPAPGSAPALDIGPLPPLEPEALPAAAAAAATKPDAEPPVVPSSPVPDAAGPAPASDPIPLPVPAPSPAVEPGQLPVPVDAAPDLEPARAAPVVPESVPAPELKPVAAAPPVDPALTRTGYSNSGSTQDTASMSLRSAKGKETQVATLRAAAVGDEVITIHELMVAVNERIHDVVDSSQAVDPEELKKLKNQVAPLVLKQLIDQSLLIQEAKRTMKNEKNLKAFNEYIAKLWKDDELPALYRQNRVSTEYELKLKLEQQGKSYDGMKEAFRKRLLAQDFMRKEIRNKLSTDLIDLRSYYGEHLQDFNRPARMSWREVEVGFARYPSREAALKQARAIHARLARGEDFAAVAKATGEGPTAAAGGLYSDITPGGYGIAPVNEELGRLAIGQLSGVIEAPNSFHIVRVESRRDAGPLRFDEVQDLVKREVFNKQLEKAINEYLDKLRSRTLIRTMFDAPEKKTAKAPIASKGR